VRLDFTSAFLNEQDQFEVRVNCCAQEEIHCSVALARNRAGSMRMWKGEDAAPAQNQASEPEGDAKRNAALGAPLTEGGTDASAATAAFARIFELRLPFKALETKIGDQVRLQISLWIDQLPVQVVPQEGPLTVELAERFEG